MATESVKGTEFEQNKGTCSAESSVGFLAQAVKLLSYYLEAACIVG
jgi:hypothetical protein